MRWRDVPPLHLNPEEDPNKSISTKSHHHHLKILLYSGYYSLSVPMKITLDSSSDEYVVKEWPVQKYLCYAAWTLSTMNRLSVLRRTYTNTLTQTTASYFQLTHAILHIIQYAVYYHTISTSSPLILTVLNGIKTSSTFDHKIPRNKLVRLLILTTQAIWSGLAITAVILGYEALNSCCWTFSTLTHAYVVHGRYTFFTEHSISPENSLHTKVDILLGLGQVLITASNVVLLFFIVCLFGNYAATLWANASGFCEAVLTELEQNEDVVERDEKSRILEWYAQAASVSNPLNSTFQLLAFWYMLDLISWLSTELVSGLRTSDYFVKIHIFYYLAYVGISLCFSAEAFRKIERLKNILRTRERKNFTPKINEDLDHLLKCLQTQIFGIGETGFFKLNYPFIGQITGLIVTFYIISIGEIKMSDTEIGSMTICGDCYL